MTKNIDSNKCFEVSDDEGEIHLLINIKYTVIVTETGSHHPKYSILHETGIL